MHRIILTFGGNLFADSIGDIGLGVRSPQCWSLMLLMSGWLSMHSLLTLGSARGTDPKLQRSAVKDPLLAFGSTWGADPKPPHGSCRRLYHILVVGLWLWVSLSTANRNQHRALLPLSFLHMSCRTARLESLFLPQCRKPVLLPSCNGSTGD